MDEHGAEPAAIQKVARRHKRESEIWRREVKRAESALRKLSPGTNRLRSTDFLNLVEFLFLEHDAYKRRVIRERRFTMGELTVEMR